MAVRSERRAASEAAALHAQRVALLGDDGLKRVSHLTFTTFDPTRLAGDASSHPYHILSDWLTHIAAHPIADYHDPAAPPACLYLYSAGKGRGKTHLAAAAAHDIARVHASGSVFLDETTYPSRYWSVPFEEQERLVALPGDRAWLTVLDDLGSMPPSRSNANSGIARAYYAVINRRWLARKWLIITSNCTLEQLVEQGTLDDRAYSRLMQMTRGCVVECVGEDYRCQS